MYNKKGAKLGVTVMLLFFVYTLQASTFHFTSGCIEAQKCIATLRLNKAEQILELEKKTESYQCSNRILRKYH